MRALIPLVLLTLASGAWAEELPPTQRAFIELEVPRTAWLVGESIPVTVRVGVERAWFDKQAVPLFRREVDHPVHIGATWLRDSSAAGGEAGRVRVGLGDEVVRAMAAPDRDVDGRAFAVFELVRRIEADTAGALTLAGATLRYAYATEFEEGFLDERVPVDRHPVRIEADALELTVADWPKEGRPPAFTNALGRITVRAAAEPTTVKVGEPIRLTVVIGGEGNLAALTPPRLDAIDGLHLGGVTDDRAAKGAERRVVYELTPTKAVAAIPAVILPFLDPGPPPTYRVAQSDPVAITVTGAPAPDATPPADVDAGDAPTEPSTDHTLVYWLVGVLFALFITLLIWAARLRSRLRILAPEVDPARLERYAAAATRLRGEGAPALTPFLATALDTAEAAVIRPDLAERLSAAGVAADVAARVAEVSAAMLAARYGAPSQDAPALAEADIEALITCLEPSA